MIKLTQLINELEINNPNQIRFIPKEKHLEWTYKGGSKELDEYIPSPGYKIAGVLIFNKYIWVMSPKHKDHGTYLVFNAKYFDKGGLFNWHFEGIDLSDDPITINNIEIIG